MNRSGAAPRVTIALLLVAIMVMVGLWYATKTYTRDLNLGGPLFPVDPEQIEGFLLTKGKLQYRFDRQVDGSWSLSGATSDYLNPGAMRSLVAVLPVALGGAILPGTESEDRRYRFNSPEAIRLRVYLTNGENISLALGVSNPVTGNYYGSGAGRDGCFPVAAPFRDKLFMLPIKVQAVRVLPVFERDIVQSMTLSRSGRDHQFKRIDGKWWLLLPDTELAGALVGQPPTVLSYQAVYDDRRRQDEEGLWLMASDQAVGQLIYEVSSVPVKDIKSPREAPRYLVQWDLDPPWRQVVLRGPGLNSDPSAPVADQYTIAFGPPVRENLVPALRRGNVMQVDFEAVNLLEEGLDALVEQQALNVMARGADHFRMERAGQLVIEGERKGEASTAEGRTAWKTIFPAKAESRYTEMTRNGMTQDLVVNLNRLDVLAPLPPTTNRAVLAEQERVRMVLTWSAEGQTDSEPRELILEFGYLEADQLPAGTKLARTQDDSPAVGLWFPATGKLLQVPSQFMTTARNLERQTKP